MADDPLPVVPTETLAPEMVSPVPDPSIPPSPSDLPKPEENSQPVPPEQTPPTEQQNTPEAKPQVEIPTLYFPFYGTISPGLTFSQIPDDERIKQKFQEWGIVGHNGLDFPLSEGTEVLACDAGKVIQSGDNGDYGVSVTIQHSWGQSIYAHLKETKVSVDQDVQAAVLIGLSNSSGTAFGSHLHFEILPNNPDKNNGYLGCIDPAPYLQTVTQKPESVQTEPPKPPEEKSVPVPQSQPEPTPIPEPVINIEPIITPPVEKPQTPQNPQIPQTGEAEIQKQVDEKFSVELEARRLKANEDRKAKRDEHLSAIEKFLQEKKEITNQDVRDLTHVAQTTATEYLSTLVKSGSIKMEGKGKATVYKNIFG